MAFFRNRGGRFRPASSEDRVNFENMRSSPDKNLENQPPRASTRGSGICWPSSATNPCSVWEEKGVPSSDPSDGVSE